MSFILMLKVFYRIYQYYPIFMKTYTTIQYSIWLYSMILYFSSKIHPISEKYDENEWVVI